MLTTKIGVLLDATGSMAADRFRTIDGFNEYLKGLKEDDATKDALISAAKFNSGDGFQVLRRDERVADTVELTADEYACDYVTPLFDATVQLIGLLERGASAERYVAVIMTDGQENASQETDFAAVNKLIEEKRKAGNWTFVFLGADLDAWSAQQAMGVQFASAQNTMSYAKADSAAAYRNVARSTVALAASGSLSTSTFFGDRTSDPGPMLPPDQAAASLGVSSAALAKMRQRGTGPSYVRVGPKTIRYPKRDVDDWKAAQKVTIGNK